MYPRELNLGAEEESKLIQYLNYEIDTHNGERSALVQELIDYQNDYIAKPRTEVKSFPFRGAANIVIPITAIVVESVAARVLTRLFGLDQFVSAQVVDQFSQLDRPLEKYMDWEMIDMMDFRKKITGPVFEWIKLGNCVAKIDYARRVKNVVRNIGGSEEVYDVVVSNGPELIGIPVANYLMPFNSQDPQTANWCGEIHRANKNKFKDLCESGLLKKDSYDKLDGYFLAMSQGSGPSDAYKQNIESKTNTTEAWPNELEWYEIYLSWNVDNDPKKKRKEIVVHYHRISQAILSIRYNWYSDVRRPYRIASYIPLEYRWRGIGVGQQSKEFQKEITVQHRQRLDAGTLANANMIKVKKLTVS